MDYLNVNKKITNRLINKFGLHKGILTPVLQARYEFVMQVLLPYIQDSIIIELGARDGSLLSMMVNHNPKKLVGVDICDEAINILREKGLEGYVDNIETFTLGYKADIVIMSHVLEHVKNPKKVVDNVCSFLSPKGLVYVEVPLEKKLKPKHGHFTYFKHGGVVDKLFNEFSIIHKSLKRHTNKTQRYRVLYKRS